MRPNRKSVYQITDRAKRYRANEEGVRPAGPRKCAYCCGRQNVGVHHVDGNENHGERKNLTWACKSCNAKIAAWMKRVGIGTRTRQYNPARGSKKALMDQYSAAVKVMRGEFEGDMGKALDVIHSTPANMRSAFTSRSWPIRRQRYGPSGRANMGKRKRNSSDSSVKSPTRTSTEVRSPTRTKTATSTDAYTAGNITVTGGAGAGATKVTIHQRKPNEDPKGGQHRPRNTTKSNRGLVTASNGQGKIERYVLNLGRRNPVETAAERYEYFHGRPPANESTFTTPKQVHKVLSGIGKLLVLEIFAIDGQRKVKLEGFKGALLAQDEKGKQLYIAGGDQSVNLADFGIKNPHEQEILGALQNIVYFTTKDHLRPEDGGTAGYKHKFGGEGREKKYAFGQKGSRLPLVGYDVRNKLLSIQGGGYELPAEGIDG